MSVTPRIKPSSAPHICRKSRSARLPEGHDCATDAERLDAYNGFLLAANLDALFDRGLITFDEIGRMLFSDRLVDPARIALGLGDGFRLRWISEQHQGYLRWHREHVFGK